MYSEACIAEAASSVVLGNNTIAVAGQFLRHLQAEDRTFNGVMEDVQADPDIVRAHRRA
jgi:hypothetical protein